VVDHVITDSPAGLAGLKRGDVVIRYGGERIFFLPEFKQATTQGEPEDLVLIDVMRGDAEVVLRVPRGPLGIRIQPRGDPPLSCY
jgi:S1-C subfamily serine protease